MEEKKIAGSQQKKAATKGELLAENKTLKATVDAMGRDIIQLREAFKAMSQMIVQNFNSMNQLSREQTALANLVRSEPIKGAAKLGDTIIIDFLGRNINEDGTAGEDFEGGEGKGFALELGSGTLIADFETQLLGASEGQNLDLKVAFPADYGKEVLRGQTKLFHVEVIKVYRDNSTSYTTTARDEVNKIKEAKKILDTNAQA